MSDLITRAQWGARPSRGTGNALATHPLGNTIHWEGSHGGTYGHDQCAARVRSIQAFHQDVRGWADIAYNVLVCPHGFRFEGRGRGRGSAANATNYANTNYYATCAMVGTGDPVTDALIQGLVDACDMVRAWGAGSAVVGHRDWVGTECPGQALYDMVKAGRFGPHASTPVIVPATYHVPAKGGMKAPAFPLPRGWYFGPSAGPKASVSGYYGHASDLKVWQKRMKDRGWSIVADGLYGPATKAVATAFQREKHLQVDGLIGPQTWASAWTLAVTR